MSRRKLDDAPMSGVFEEERRREDGRRKIKLTKAERSALVRVRRAEAAAALFLDLKEARTWKQIAEDLELSPAQLRDLTKTDEFETAYNQLFAEIQHDPRYQATRGKLADMLPLAVSELEKLLTTPGISSSVRLKAALKVMELNGIEKQKEHQSDRQELADFLAKHAQPAQNNFNFFVPADYLRAQQDYQEVVDGEVVELEEPSLLEPGCAATLTGSAHAGDQTADEG